MADLSSILIEGSEEIYYCDNERDPYKEVEASEDVVESLLPILSLWWGYDIFSEKSSSSDRQQEIQDLEWGDGELLVHQINRKGMNVNLTNSVSLSGGALDFTSTWIDKVRCLGNNHKSEEILELQVVILVGGVVGTL